MANLASMYGNQSRWKEAKELEVQVIETRKKAGRGTYFHTDRYEQSCVHMERSGSRQGGYQLMKGSVQLRERVLRLDHPLTSSSRVVLNRWEYESLESVPLDV